MNLYCERYPNQAADNILFIHGNLASTAWWQPMLGEWRKLGSTGPASLIFADWRGCGQNPEWPPAEVFSIANLAEDFIHLLERERIKKINLVGHSLGGLIALQMMILRPDLVSKAMLLDPVGAGGVVFDDSMYEAFRQMAQSRDLTRTVILSTVLRHDHIAESFKDQIAEDAYKAVRGIGSSVLEILKTVDLRAPAKTVKIPTLIVHGREDAIIPLKDSEELAKLMPAAQLEVLEGVGHCWNLENPSAFCQRVRKWFS
ncbi:MAG: alpha/beta fold hydrolase [Bdellovibrionales bacterium]